MPLSIKRADEYPNPRDNEIVTKRVIRIGTTKSFLIVEYESSKTIRIYVGGHIKWCINCDIIKRDNIIQPIGYLNQVRYDLQCSLEHSFLKGIDTKQIVYFLVQYIHNRYPEVKELLFSDLSIRQCDNYTYVNLAVMTYLYSEQTWYEKNFGAYISPKGEEEYKRIKKEYEKVDKNGRNKVDWEIIRNTIMHNTILTKMSDSELEVLYNKSKTWKEFFEPIYNKIKIDKFCIFISIWLSTFINRYFNTLQGLKYMIPVKDNKIEYVESEYKTGGRRFTRKSTMQQDKDYQ
jgi:hypothetical protein